MKPETRWLIIGLIALVLGIVVGLYAMVRSMPLGTL